MVSHPGVQTHHETVHECTVRLVSLSRSGHDTWSTRIVATWGSRMRMHIAFMYTCVCSRYRLPACLAVCDAYLTETRLTSLPAVANEEGAHAGAATRWFERRYETGYVFIRALSSIRSSRIIGNRWQFSGPAKRHDRRARVAWHRARLGYPSRLAPLVVARKIFSQYRCINRRIKVNVAFVLRNQFEICTRDGASYNLTCRVTRRYARIKWIMIVTLRAFTVIEYSLWPRFHAAAADNYLDPMEEPFLFSRNWLDIIQCRVTCLN